MKTLIEIDDNTLSALIAGMYINHNNLLPEIFPQSLFMELTEKLIPYLNKWDYLKCSFEEWIKTFLVILPVQLISEVELAEMKVNNEIFIERDIGNASYICTAPVVCVDEKELLS